jgi:head-tail adaptor
MVNIRNYRYRVEIQTSIHVPDGIGGEALDWVKLKDVWASVEEVPYSKISKNPAHTGVMGLRVWLRKSPLTESLTILHRLSYKGKQYKITEISSTLDQVYIACLKQSKSPS